MNQNNIKPQELRIGNWVALSRTMPMRIYEIHEDCFYAKGAKGDSFKNTWADIQPIPLSNEVLLRTNFMAYKNVFAFEFIDLHLSIDVNFTKSGGHVVSIFDEKSDFERVLSMNMNLHELQNLIASFGEELEVRWT